MISSGVWTENNEKGGITIGITDYGVEAFGGSDWEWSASFDEKNTSILIKNLRKDYDDKKPLTEILTELFGEVFSTIDFTKYCDSLGLKYEIRREC